MRPVPLAAVLFVSVVALSEAHAQQPAQPLNSIYVLGEVLTPAMYQFQADRPFTILQAIALARGFTEKADKKTVEIRRHGAAAKIIADVGAIQIGSAPDIYLRSGDIVWVPKWGTKEQYPPIDVPNDSLQKRAALTR